MESGEIKTAIGALPEAETQAGAACHDLESAPPILLPYQHRWVSDRSPLKIWLASRQVGKSFALSLEAVREALKRKCDNLLLSASERQSKELMLKVLSHLRCLNVLTEDGATNAEKQTREEIRLPGGSRIISLPASPDTVRGFSGNIFLDEFAFHKDAREIWRAMYPSVTRGHKVRISSTPNGKQNMFYELWAGAARSDYSGGGSAPNPPLRDKVPQTPVWSRHRTDIYEAVEEGLKVDIAALRAGVLDPDSWAQEFECRFVDEATAFITYEMIASCEEDIPLCGGSTPAPPQGPAALCRGMGTESPFEKEFYLGVDIGRKHDLTVFWLLEKTGGVLRTRMVHVMDKAPFRAQREFLWGLMDTLSLALPPQGGGDIKNIPSLEGRDTESVRRCCIDSTGIGAQLAEEAAEIFGLRVEPVVFTQAVKEDLAIALRRKFEDRLVRVPSDREIREDIHSVKKTMTAAGNLRFDAARSDGSHADRFWALALAVHAACSPAVAVEYEAVAKRSWPDSFQARWQAVEAGCW